MICDKCPNMRHIALECTGCGAKYSTKNCGGVKADGTAILHRTLFLADPSKDCTCDDPTQFGVKHNHQDEEH